MDLNKHMSIFVNQFITIVRISVYLCDPETKETKHGNTRRHPFQNGGGATFTREVHVVRVFGLKSHILIEY